MAITISSIEDTGMSMSSSGWTRTRQKVVSGDSWEELYLSGVFPQYGSRHPENTYFRLTSANISAIGNEGRKVQALWEGTYTTNQTEFDNFDSDPWELDAQEVSVTPTTEQVVMTKGYYWNEAENKWYWRPLVNSARCPIVAETTRPITELSFIYAVKGDNRDEAPVNISGLINARKETVAGYTIDKWCGLLLPMSAKYITEYDELKPGEEKRRYWEMSVTIRINEKTQAKSFLDVGTLALFGNSTVPEPIFQFYDDPLNHIPKFGSIKQAMAYKKAWEKKYEGQKDAPSFSWTEITEPLPLKNGEIYYEAMNKTKNVYNTIELYESLPVSWNKYDLPRKRA